MFVAAACNNAPQQKNIVSHTANSQNIAPYKYSNVQVFKIDTIDWYKRKDFYVRIDSTTFFKIYQDPSIKEYPGLDTASNSFDFYYSTQQNKRGLKEITILSQREGESCVRINYMIYDKGGKSISSFLLASSCADGGFYEKSYGKFMNDSTYVLYSEDNYDSKDIEKNPKVSCDQITTTIKANGTTSSKMVPLKMMPKL